MSGLEGQISICPTDADCERFTRERYGKDKRITAETPFRMWI